MAKRTFLRAGDYHVPQNAEINVTPFVDVMLVLLIIFMVAAPLATVNVKVELPDAVAPSQKPPDQPVYISLQKSGGVWIGDNRSSLETLGADLKRILPHRNFAEERIYIRGDEDLAYEQVMRLMAKLQDEGFYSVALMGKEGAVPK